MKRAPHASAALLALILSALAAEAFSFFSGSIEKKYVHAVAALDHSKIGCCSAIERIALQQPDLLLIYGASELVLLDTKYEATRFFSTYPTGFMVFNAATKGGSSLTVAQRLAALGPVLRGKRVIFAIGPAIMTMAPFGEVAERHYAGNFFEPQALELAYSRYLKNSTKRLAAERMLDFPETLKNKPLLSFALHQLTGDSFINQILYLASWPLGELQLGIMRLQDHYATIRFIRHLSEAEITVTRQPRQIDWESLAKIAEQEQIRNSDSNPYGVDNSQWPKIKELFDTPIPPGSRDDDFLNDVAIAREWSDLEIALKVMRELGAHAIIMSSPMNVPLWETIGVSERAQNMYYTLLHSVVAPYGIPVVDSKQYGKIEYFSMDLASHASRKGWIYVDQTLDRIFHGQLP